MTESVRKRGLPAQPRQEPQDLGRAGQEVALAALCPGMRRALAFGDGEGWCVCLLEDLCVYLSGQLGWGFVSVSVPQREGVKLSFLQGLCLCSSGRCVHDCCSLGQRIL